MDRPQVRLLLVEDDRVDRLACRRALAQHPDFEFVIAEAETGREGLQHTVERKPDCILLDYRLPDLSGLEFLAGLSAGLGEGAPPVVMLTGTDNVAVAVEAMRRGARDYLIKDIERRYLELLPAVIAHVLREQRLLDERRQTEAKLRETEAKFRTLVEQIPAIAYSAALDAPGTLLYISPQIARFGYTQEEWLNNPDGWLARVHADDRARVLGAFAAIYETGDPMRCEYRLLTRSGDEVWVLDEARVVRDPLGEPLLLQGILVDITEDRRLQQELEQHRRRLEELVTKRTAQLDKRTALLTAANANLDRELEERRRAEQALRKAGAELEDLYHNAPCGYHSLDKNGVFVRINDTELQWLGYTREEIIGKRRLLDLLTPASQRILQEAFPGLKERGGIKDLEFEMVRKDGTLLPVLLNATAIKNTDNEYCMSRATMFDIAARKRAEAALRASEERFRLLLETVGEGICGLDAAGRCTFVNQAALDMLGYAHEEILGRPLHALIHHTRPDGTACALEECPVCNAFRAGNTVRRVSETLWRRDGNSFPAEYSAYPIRENGTVTGAVLVFRDATEAQAAARRLSYMATHDALTGLVNRHEFERRLERALMSAREDGSLHALCYLDLDRFKAVNDVCGHAAGDELLRQLSAALRERTRSRDTLARLGGDEFTALLEHCKIDQAHRIAEDLRKAVEEFAFAWRGRTFTVGASIGLVALTGTTGSAAQALSAADAACYAAKKKGRNQVYVFGPDAVSAANH